MTDAKKLARIAALVWGIPDTVENYQTDWDHGYDHGRAQLATEIRMILERDE